MTYTDVSILMEHTGHTKATVLKAIKLTKTPTEVLPGTYGIRVTETNANKMIRKMWPRMRPLRVADYQQPTAILARIKANTEQ